MEIGKRYWVVWAGARADGSFCEVVGMYAGPSTEWPGFACFKFDKDAGKITGIRGDLIERFTEAAP